MSRRMTLYHTLLRLGLFWAVLNTALPAASAAPGELDLTDAGLGAGRKTFTAGMRVGRTAAPRAPTAGVVGDGTPASCTEAALTAALAGGGLVTFNCGGPKSITVTSSQGITQAITIAGGDVITLTGGGANRLFFVDTGATLTLQHIVLENGRVNGGNGGSIYNRGRLYLDHARITNSQGHLSDYGGAIVTYGPLDISDSALDHNLAGFGGAIYADNFYNAARVTITNSVLSANQAANASGQGGAIMLGTGAQLTMTDGSLQSNSALRYGGAVYLSANSRAYLTGSSLLSINDNQAAWDGGALYNNDGILSVARADLIGNRTPTDAVAIGYGGAVFSLGELIMVYDYVAHNEGRFGGAVCACAANPTSQVLIGGTTFGQNTASQFGGGLYSNTGVTVYLSESSFNGNSAGAGGGLARVNASLYVARSSFTYNSAQSGGGMLLATAPITDHTIGGYVGVHDVTLSGNTATGGLGGGVYNSGLAQLYSVTFKDNSSGLYNESGADGRWRSSVLQDAGANCQGQAPTDDGFNFATDLTCAFPNSTQATGLDPKLGPLASDGLLETYYHLPAADSPLVNHGPPNPSQCEAGDQRELPRTDRCDIGAVEYRGPLPLIWLPLVPK